jgi:hypothetical protein
MLNTFSRFIETGSGCQEQHVTVCVCVCAYVCVSRERGAVFWNFTSFISNFYGFMNIFQTVYKCVRLLQPVDEVAAISEETM